ncbi:BglII/BstYI family type II restriction endonuclease [Priestia megaterium]|uniref:BglII/BstYI family type II restriction endonuclease n=1 Tax=Priestia megaterium TaxID=1404 RepID=UPI002E224FED|nr:BglII/BstYI family type II restriction endonuclease [Priestia megaterium]MED4061115.1 BglII/BstYI family type II restriction endonuclease [Priestia megaterium]
MIKKPVKIEKMDIQEALQWNSRTSGNLVITEENQLFFRHADLFLMNFEEIKNDIFKALQMQLTGIKHFTKEKKLKDTSYFQRRITADTLNNSLKNNLKYNIPNMKFEVEYEEGIFYDTPKIGGFDFGLFDDTYNLINFRNYCFGRRSIHNGQEKWNRELIKRKEWRDLAIYNDLESYEIGIDVSYNKKVPTIIGEVQFGNWALVYYDLLKTIQIEQTFEIDLLIYITAAGNLQRYISDGTVNLDGVREALEEFKNIIKFPIWVIGVDFE